MKYRDVIEISLGNLWRMKLRTLLTLFGVIIAIGAFVSMLSLGAGMQEQVSRQFEKLGLLFTIQVYPKKDNNEESSKDEPQPLLNDSAVLNLSQLPGVQLAYPFDEYQTKTTINDTTIDVEAQPLSVSALKTKLFSRIKAGRVFESDSAKEAIVTDEFLEMLEIEHADSILGTRIVVSIEVASFDSGLVHVFKSDGKLIWDRFKDIRFDSLANSEYRSRVLTRELGGAASRFFDGYLNARTPVADTLVITGVLKTSRGRSRTSAIILPLATGKKFSAAGFSGDMTSIIAGISSGSLFQSSASRITSDYSKVTLNIEPGVPHGPIRDSIKALGFRSFSYAEEFEEIQLVFTYFNMGLSVLGLIALFVSSLGIVNTMLMSITERRREICIMKSLGADESEIKFLFLIESAMIGTIGSLLGLLLGWIVSRVISIAVQAYMVEQGADPIELFSLPLWLVGASIALGLSVSLIAGYLPAARAAKIDPVQALRYE